MKAIRMVLGGMANNTYIMVSDDDKSAVLVDPAYEPERIMEYLSGQGLTLKAVLITHGHFDHFGALPTILRHLDVPVYTHTEEGRFMEDSIKNLSKYFTSKEVTATATDAVEDGDMLDFGDGLIFEVIVVPGHSPKSCCFYSMEDQLIITGDTLFAGSIGRTDYYNGLPTDLVKNIKEKLMFLPSETKVLPGHGETSTIGNEKAYNPYLQ